MISPTPNMMAEKDGPVGRIVFNKPAKRNATSSDMWEAIPVILDDFEKDPAIRVVVVDEVADRLCLADRLLVGLEIGRAHV